MSIKKSLFKKAVIESVDRSKTVNLIDGIISFSYYEDIFSPIATARMRVANGGNVIANGGGKQSIYNGLPLRGSERVIISIGGNSKTNKDFDFSTKPSDYFYISSISDVEIDSNRESFTLSLIPREAFSNETSRVGCKFPVDMPIHESVKKILKDYLKTEKVGIIDNTSNNYGFMGNLKKPFTLLLWLASKGVPDASKDGSAGFLFYQTKDGFQFRSIDQLITQQKKAQYIYDDSRTTYDNEGNKINNDFRILKYSVVKNNNLLDKLIMGTYCSQMITFNPKDFTFDSKVFKAADHIDKNTYLGKELAFPNDDSGMPITSKPSRVFNQILDVGVLEESSNVRVNANPQKYQSQALMRYNLLVLQQLTMTVPLNTNLRAGDLIECIFPKVSYVASETYDYEVSGLYMIKELCHYFDTTRSYTSLILIRDTFGRRGK